MFYLFKPENIIMKLKRIKEGKVKLEVPDVERPEEGEVFYNPRMERDRNISVGVLGLLKDFLDRKEIKSLDALAATGVRALRYEREGGAESWANDADPKAVELIKKNKKKNKSKIKVTNEDANLVLRKNKFDFIDIDPFGSPVPFLDSTGRSFPKKGFFAATATDTAPLSGTYPKVCLRRYGVRSFKPGYYKELGLRILISSIVRNFSKYEKAFVPRLSYSRLHYFRVYGEVKKGVKPVEEILDRFEWISHCRGCGWRLVGLKKNCPLCGAETKFCRVYMGGLQDSSFCKELGTRLRDRDFFREASFVESLGKELKTPFYYDTHHIAKKTGKEIGKIKKLIEKLKENGFKATRTHFCNTAVKTDASFEDFVEIF